MIGGIGLINKARSARRFQASDIAGLTSWISTDNIADLFQNDAMTIPVTADNQSVGGWRDRSGNNYHYKVGALAAPTYQTNELNGKACVRWAGGQGLASTILNNLIGPNTGSVAVVLRSSAITNNSATIHLNDPVFSDAPGGYIGMYLRNDVPSVGAYNYDGAGDATYVSQALNTPTILIWRHDGPSLDMVSNIQGQTTVGSGPTLDLTNTLRVGINYNSVQFLTADIFELATYNVPLLGDDLTRLVVGWEAKYGL